MALPGPDRPRRVRGKGKAGKKPPRLRTTPGNRYTSRPPATSVPGAPINPATGRPYTTTNRGTGYGPGIAPAAPTAPGVTAAGTPAPAKLPISGGTPPPMPYAEYADQPWARTMLQQIDAEQKNHQNYVTGTVAPWLSSALTGLTGVDPANPGLNTTLQQQYLANVQGVVGGAMNAAATAAPAQVASTMPGGIVASPTAYLTGAAQQGAQGRASSMLQSAQIQSALNTMQPNTQAQGYVYALADYAKGLPAVYAERRAEARTRIDQFIADQQQAAAQLQFDMQKQSETMRHNRVTESISATNASTNAAFQASRLGLDAQGQAYDQANPNVTGGDGPFPAGTPAPAGKTAVTGADGMTYFVDDASYVPPGGGGGGGNGGGTSTRDAQGRLRVPSLQDKGYTRFGKKPPAKYDKTKFQITQGADGNYWIKKKTGAGSGASGSTYKPRASTELQASLAGYWKAGGSGGIEARFVDNPKGAGTWLAQWVRDNKRDFIVKGRKADIPKLRQVLASIGGRPAAEALSILTRGYLSPDGTWK